ncbi:hypothetical protein [Saccharococcus caldoxylosilyticus]|uniref:hypothetical protein n=1 Tax=Saccharococcus caldoxylosilyticus TaxID=81408 RepID=UPI001C4E2A90|nr:hypothetical protein [Parageobacillus caldoxylosilyticus]QXJ39062.1 hypothetical protein BV455_02427 [Parageobacillus caldoxylosilyticus]BDG37248.1 hypothetical protein PcaKH15_31540 [Parageobacillus caldoxylosilyticus]BDG41039.1 hypothetical protein PcaKH16_31780 [Parageobacillus caldoxylosilyticus]BDG44790.1 hypothetical protein PcaKH35_31350 [Parageobacillus caldoxylosilyticus]
METLSGEVLSDIDLEICTAVLMKEWVKRYKRVFKIDFNFREHDVDRIKDMVRKWGYEKTYICMAGAIRFYPEKWRTKQFKWLTVNQVYTWIGEEVWKMYQNNEFKVRIVKPKL